VEKESTSTVSVVEKPTTKTTKTNPKLNGRHHHIIFRLDGCHIGHDNKKTIGKKKKKIARAFTHLPVAIVAQIPIRQQLALVPVSTRRLARARDARLVLQRDQFDPVASFAQVPDGYFRFVPLSRRFRRFARVAFFVDQFERFAPVTRLAQRRVRGGFGFVPRAGR
jgi:hypothetical protein|tara:strand:+ start:184 stop:681 length:498 start_codon:yes stop_codon:yes gene_type:complete